MTIKNAVPLRQARRMASLAELLVFLSISNAPVVLSAQGPLSGDQLDQLVARVALYPDALLAQVLAASTYSEQIPDAAEWSDSHSYLNGEALAAAISEDNLPWDPSVLALLPFPSVLDMMSSDISWTRQLGDTLLSQRAEAMEAIQRERETAKAFGYLQDCSQYRVVTGDSGVIEIIPANPPFYYVPVYDPSVVFSRRRVGLAVGISFGPEVVVGAAFAPFGWRQSSVGWATHTLILNDKPWMRTRENRETYVHPYSLPRQAAGPRVEHHELRPSRPRREESTRKEERK